MAKPLEPRMKFLVPLENGQFLPGYIAGVGNMFILVNIFRNAQSERKEPMEFPESEILLRDYMTWDHVFSRSKRITERPWILYKSKKVSEMLPLTIEGILVGSDGPKTVLSALTGEVLRKATEEDLRNLPKHGIESARYYSISVEAALQGRKVEFDPIERRFYIA